MSAFDSKASTTHVQDVIPALQFVRIDAKETHVGKAANTVNSPRRNSFFIKLSCRRFFAPRAN